MKRVICAPSTYIQGPGERKHLAEYYMNYGTEGACMIQDPFVSETYGTEIEASFREKKIPFVTEVFKGECCLEEINGIMGQMGKADVIFGIGGGKVQDTAKAAGYFSGLPVIIVPTAASTDAPCSRLSVLYKKNRTFDRYLELKENPRMVVMDTEVIANSPARMFAAGMGDALSTWYEASACARTGAVTRAGGGVSAAALALARACLEVILEWGPQALEDVKKKRCTQAVEQVTEANTYLSGIGFESGGLAGAHGLHNGLSLFPEAASVMHGEKVAFCTLVQMILEGRKEEEIETVRAFCRKVGLPVSLADLGLEHIEEEKLLEAAKKSLSQEETMKNLGLQLTPEEIVKVMRNL